MAPRDIRIGPGWLREDVRERESGKQIPHTVHRLRERVRDDKLGIGSRAAKLSVARVSGNEQKLRSAGILFFATWQSWVPCFPR